MKLRLAVLSHTSVYRCLKGKFCIRKKIPFKDTQCAECINNGLIVDALIVGKVKGVKRRITENVLNSYCKLENNESDSTTKNKIKSSRKLEFRNEEWITDHNRKKCSTINYQELIRRHNPEINWDQEVTWHQWQNVIVGENNANEGAQKSPNKECVDRVVNCGVINKEHSKNDTGSMPNKKQDK